MPANFNDFFNDLRNYEDRISREQHWQSYRDYRNIALAYLFYSQLQDIAFALNRIPDALERQTKISKSGIA